MGANVAQPKPESATPKASTVQERESAKVALLTEARERKDAEVQRARASMEELEQAFLVTQKQIETNFEAEEFRLQTRLVEKFEAAVREVVRRLHEEPTNKDFLELLEIYRSFAAAHKGEVRPFGYVQRIVFVLFDIHIKRAPRIVEYVAPESFWRATISGTDIVERLGALANAMKSGNLITIRASFTKIDAMLWSMSGKGAPSPEAEARWKARRSSDLSAHDRYLKELEIRQKEEHMAKVEAATKAKAEAGVTLEKHSGFFGGLWR